MASSTEFVAYACDQMREAGEISYRKMFGDYAVYCDRKVIGLICDNTFYMKKTEAGANLLGPTAEEAPPYPGAKPYFVVEDLDDREAVCELIRQSYEQLPMPKPRKKKTGNAKIVLEAD